MGERLQSRTAEGNDILPYLRDHYELKNILAECARNPFVARAVIASPKLLLADEPTGNLHSAQGEEIMKLFKELNRQGATIVQVTHSDANAAYGNRIIRLRDGWIET